MRRSTALAAAALLLSAPLLASCGFSPATDRINTLSAGVNDRSGNIDVLGAVIVAPANDTGTFVATLSNNLTGEGETDTLASLTGGGDNTDVKVAGTLSPIAVAPGASVSMIGRQLGIPITGTFSVGQFVTVTLGFQSGQSTTITVPVVRPCLQYAGITSTPLTGGPGASSSTTPTAPPITMVPSQQTSPESSGTDVDGGNNDPYSCDYAVRPTDTPSSVGTAPGVSPSP